LRKIIFAVISMFVVSCGMKNALVSPDNVTRPYSATIDEYWMPGKEEGDFKGISPLPPSESCIEVIKSPGPLDEADKQQGSEQNEEQGSQPDSGSENSQGNPTGSN